MLVGDNHQFHAAVIVDIGNRQARDQRLETSAFPMGPSVSGRQYGTGGGHEGRVGRLVGLAGHRHLGFGPNAGLQQLFRVHARVIDRRGRLDPGGRRGSGLRHVPPAAGQRRGRIRWR